nr:ATP-binding protein [Bradyrhizobium yuanmingense]
MTTNKPFVEWFNVFPNAAWVVSMVDHLVHRAEVISIEGDSYRFKEARERAEIRASRRAATKSSQPKAPPS